MKKRYFRKDDSTGEKPCWIEMTGQEFYQFVTSPEGRTRHFIDMGDVVLEADKTEAKAYRAEKDRAQRVAERQAGWKLLSLESDLLSHNGESLLTDDGSLMEEESLLQLEIRQLRAELERLDGDSYRILYALYLAEAPKTLRQLSRDTGIPVMTLQNRKEKILRQLRKCLSEKLF